MGTVSAKQKIKGTINWKVSSFLEKGPLDLEFGVASQAKRLPISSMPIKFEVSPKKSVELSVSHNVQNESMNADQSIETAETAEVIMTVKNMNGSLSASNITLKVTNLAGRQVDANVRNLSVNKIKPNKSAKFVIDIAAEEIKDNKIRLGYELTSLDLAQPIFDTITLEATPQEKSEEPIQPAIAH